MIAYHGSPSSTPIRKFKKSKTGALGPGIYFTTDVKEAERYATKYQEGEIYEAELEVKNPLHIHNLSDPAVEILSPALYKRRTAENGNYCYWIKSSDLKKLQKAGYDAIIMKDEIMVFEPEQITILSARTVKAL